MRLARQPGLDGNPEQLLATHNRCAFTPGHRSSGPGGGVSTCRFLLNLKPSYTSGRIAAEKMSREMR